MNITSQINLTMGLPAALGVLAEAKKEKVTGQLFGYIQALHESGRVVYA